MSDYIFEVGDVVRLSGTYRLALIVAGCDKDGFYPVVEVKDDFQYNDAQNFQADRWHRYDIEILIPCMYAKDFPTYEERRES